LYSGASWKRLFAGHGNGVKEGVFNGWYSGCHSRYGAPLLPIVSIHFSILDTGIYPLSRRTLSFVSARPYHHTNQSITQSSPSHKAFHHTETFPPNSRFLHSPTKNICTFTTYSYACGCTHSLREACQSPGSLVCTIKNGVAKYLRYGCGYCNQPGNRSRGQPRRRYPHVVRVSYRSDDVSTSTCPRNQQLERLS
jgi:hypothetical protein